MNSAITSQPVSTELSIMPADADNADADQKAKPHNEKFSPHKSKVGPYIINLACGGLASLACGALSPAAGVYATFFLAGALVGFCTTGTTKMMTKNVHERAVVVAAEARKTPVNTATTAIAEKEPANLPGNTEEALVNQF